MARKVFKKRVDVQFISYNALITQSYIMARKITMFIQLMQYIDHSVLHHGRNKCLLPCPPRVMCLLFIPCKYRSSTHVVVFHIALVRHETSLREGASWWRLYTASRWHVLKPYTHRSPLNEISSSRWVHSESVRSSYCSSFVGWKPYKLHDILTYLVPRVFS